MTCYDHANTRIDQLNAWSFNCHMKTSDRVLNCCHSNFVLTSIWPSFTTPSRVPITLKSRFSLLTKLFNIEKTTVGWTLTTGTGISPRARASWDIIGDNVQKLIKNEQVGGIRSFLVQFKKLPVCSCHRYIKWRQKCNSRDVADWCCRCLVSLDDMFFITYPNRAIKIGILLSACGQKCF